MENKPPTFCGGRVFDVPLGFRFSPSDVELLKEYLMPKVLRHILPISFINDAEVLRWNPCEIPGDMGREKKYFFCNREDKEKSYKPTNGYDCWKAVGEEEVIWDTQQQIPKAIGMKRMLKFSPNLKNPGVSAETHNWMVREFRLATMHNNELKEVGDWMVCEITSTKKRFKPIKKEPTKNDSTYSNDAHQG